MKIARSILVLVAVVALAGCATKVKRVEPTEVVDFSGRWNDTDARMTAEELITQCLDGMWLDDFQMAEGRKPTVIVGTIVNRSHEHINAQVFVEDLERALINSRKVSFVASKVERDEVREERLDQQENARAETQAELKAETGADLMLKGVVNSVKDETRGKYAILFQVDLELIDMTTNEKLWTGQKKIKKVVKNPKYSM